MIETFLFITIGTCFVFATTLANVSCNGNRPGSKKPSENVKKAIPILNIENIEVQYECAICLEEIDIDSMYTLHCTHAFHEECIRKWFHKSKKAQCPLCLRQAIK